MRRRFEALARSFGGCLAALALVLGCLLGGGGLCPGWLDADLEEQELALTERAEGLEAVTPWAPAQVARPQARARRAGTTPRPQALRRVTPRSPGLRAETWHRPRRC
ncbi:MAG: hypothetical protein AB7N76_24055 [Planctomycetota bacterium]